MSSVRSPQRILLCLLSALPLCGCPLDTRRLQQAPVEPGDGAAGGSEAGSAGVGGELNRGSSGSSSDANGSGSSTGATAGVGAAGGASNGGGGSGTGGEAGSGSVELVDGCVDLDRNGVGDCRETLLKNADFKQGVDAWQVGATPQLSWSAQNRSTDKPSGSASVVFVSEPVDSEGVTASAAGQCLKVDAGAQLELRANAFIPGDQGIGLASLSLWFYDSDDCSGARADAFDVVHAQSGIWLTLSGEPVAPDAAHSMLVRLTSSKALRSPSFEVLFDNVLLRVRP